MNIACIGIDYNKADIDFRSRVALSTSKYAEVYERFLNTPMIAGAIILATCNRTEFYIHFASDEIEDRHVFELIKDSFGLGEKDFERFYIRKYDQAVEHIFKVASGLESMILGEDQILSQVKEAQKRAMDYKAADKALNKLFREAITCAKEIKSKTRMSENKLSISSIAVDLAEAELKNFEGKKALVVGVGEMSKLAIKNLYEMGIMKVYLANRSLERCQKLLLEHPGLCVIDFDSRFSVLGEVDVVLTATGAPHAIFDVERFKKACHSKKMVVIDMAVPRDVEEGIGRLPNITLYDIDDFKEISDRNAALRNQLAEESLLIIESYMEEVRHWAEENGIHQLLHRVDRLTDSHIANQAQALMHKLELPEVVHKDRARDYALSLTNNTLKKLILKLKDMPKDKSAQYAKMLQELLG